MHGGCVTRKQAWNQTVSGVRVLSKIVPAVTEVRLPQQPPIPAGDVTVKMLFEADEPTPSSGGHVSLWAGGTLIGEGDMPRTVPIAFSSYAGMAIGRDNGLVVDLDYADRAPYAFTGTVHEVVFDLKPAHHEAEFALHVRTGRRPRRGGLNVLGRGGQAELA